MGNVIDVSYDNGVYIVYVPEKTKQIRYRHEDYYPGSIVFGEPVDRETTYSVSLYPDNLAIEEGYSWLVLNIQDEKSNPISECMVLIDEERYKTDENGFLELYLNIGTHDYVVSETGYADYCQSVTLSDLPLTCSVVMVKETVQKNGENATKQYYSKSDSKTLAWFLTDKMNQELCLMPQQLQDVYEINFDYFNNVHYVGLSSETELNLRYRSLSFVLDETQWMRYLATAYFIDPLEANGKNGNFRPILTIQKTSCLIK